MFHVRGVRRFAQAGLFAILLGFLTIQTAHSEATNYTYDELGRLTSIQYLEGGVAVREKRFSYDPAGNRTMVETQLAALIDITGSSATEGSSIAFTLSRGGNLDLAVDIDWSVTDITTSGLSDLTALSGSLTIASGATSGTISIGTVNDSAFELQETFTLEISSATAGAVLLTSAVTGTVNDNDPVPSFSINDVIATEGGNLIFTVTKADSTSFTHAVSFTTANGSAVAGSDYVANNGSLSFAPAETSKTITVTGAGAADTTFELQETFTVGLSAPTNSATISDATGLGTINDNDTAPSFTIGDVIATEGSNFVFTVTKSNDATSLTHAVSFTTANGSAVAGSDYVANSGSVSFAPAETSKMITITGAGDTIFELQETFNVNLSAPTNSATMSDGSGLGTINDNDMAPSFSIGNVFATEGGNIVFTVTKTDETAVTHALSYATSNGSALAGSDFVEGIGSISFAPADVSKTITITGLDDTVFEPQETFTVQISDPTNLATILDDTGAGFINENDPVPSFSVDDVSTPEGGSLVFTITKANATSLTHAVNYVTNSGTAQAVIDFTVTGGVLSFAPSEMSKTVSVATILDSIFEQPETLTLDLSFPTNSATLADGSGIGTINENGEAPAFIIGNVTASEGGSLIFTVSKTGTTALTHAVSFTTANGSAVAGSDYVANSGSVSFAPADTAKTITIAGANDSKFELQETFSVVLSNPTNGATITVGTGVGTINDNDTAPSFSIGNTAATEGGNLVFTVTKSNTTSLTHAVSYTTQNGTAVAGSDYVSKSGTLTFTSGETSKTITITGANDDVFELTEIFSVNISAPTNLATILDGSGSGVINDNDPAPSFSVNDPPAVIEGLSITFTVTKTGPTVVTHTVQYLATSGSAQVVLDFTSTGGVLSFAPGEASKTVVVPTLVDSISEPPETFTLVLSFPTNSATLDDGSGLGTINNNDTNNPPVAVNDSYTVPSTDTQSLQVLVNDSDPDGHSLTITNVTNPSKGSAFISCSATCILFTAGNGNTSFIYTIDDGFLGTDTATVSITVTGGGDPPLGPVPQPPPEEDDGNGGTAGGGF